MSDDAATTESTTPETEGSETTPPPNGSDQAAEIASYRKRQAGAEAARQVAEAKAKELEARLAKYEAESQSASDKELSELAATKVRLEAAEKRALEAEEKATARILDAKYPNARKELPTIADEATLAKFEAMLAEGDFEPPTPLKHGESRSSQAGGVRKPETAADIKARLLAMPMPEGWS